MQINLNTSQNKTSKTAKAAIKSNRFKKKKRLFDFGSEQIIWVICNTPSLRRSNEEFECIYFKILSQIENEFMVAKRDSGEERR